MTFDPKYEEKTQYGMNEPPPPAYPEAVNGSAPSSVYGNVYSTPGSTQAGYATPTSYAAPTATAPTANGNRSAYYQSKNGTYCNVVVPTDQLQADGSLPHMCHHHSKIWFYVSLCAIILFFPLAIPGAVFAHKARQDAKRGDKLAYVKHLRISRVLTGIAIGFGISCIANVTARIPQFVKKNPVISYGGYEDSELEKRLVQNWTTSGGYIGCYTDDLADRDLNGETMFALTKEECLTSCANRGFKYAGLQSETGCYCGQEFGKHGKVDDSDCYYECPSDPDFSCGGSFKNSVYRTYYLGCYDDYNGDAVDQFSYIMPSSDATQATCISRCVQEGYEFAAVKNGEECQCSNDPNRDGETDIGSCNSACEGNADFLCGGVFKNSVYKTDYNNIEIIDNYLGCYDDDVNDRDLDGHSFDIDGIDDSEKCIDACGHLGYKYAGVQFGETCFCGNEYGKHGELAKSGCKDECTANCDGDEANYVYRTRYIGCFPDKEKRALSHEIDIDSDQNKPATCIELCETAGYQFAGIEYSYQCYCGNDPNRYEQVPEDECNSQCSGSTEHTCGGSWRISVFKTQADYE